MKKRLVLCISINLSLVIAACVVPYLEGDVKALMVEPKQSLYPLNYRFIPSEELTITIFDSLGDMHGVPVKDVTVNFTADFTVAG
jgi:hypothetical protein